MRINGLSSPAYKPIYNPVNVSQNVSNSTKSPVMTKEQMAQLLSFMTYKQNDMNLKLVRIAGELYAGKNIDQFG